MWRRRSKRTVEIHPDEIFIDAENLPNYDRDQFEGRIEKPLSRRAFLLVGVCAMLLVAGYTARASTLQLIKGGEYAKQAIENQLAEETIFADRGVIADRANRPLAYNERTDVEDDYASRVYAPYPGLAHVVGYVKPPAKDKSGYYYRDQFVGVDGVERSMDGIVTGINGMVLTETDAKGAVISQSTQRLAEDGEKVTLSVDAEVTEGLYRAIEERVQASGFQGGAAVIMDARTGEILALTSYPEYSQNALVNGDAEILAQLNDDKRRPFLDRAVSGLYAPGSIVKPVVAAAALTEGVISPDKQILSTGSISLPNPYDPAHPSIFRDWRANGWVDIRHALAISSDVYFYEVGGGFQGQKGLGITLLDKYFRLFGFGSNPGLPDFSEADGSIPTPNWKAENFPEDPTWRIGDTYHTAIGQYGMQVSPLQAAREAAALASGKLFTPSLLASSTPQFTPLPISNDVLNIVREGMRLSVTEGIAGAVKFADLPVAAKTGTAQVGVHNEFVNSWMIGFWPYENPRYAYAIVLERGPAGTTMGAPAAMGTFLQWMYAHAKQYL